MGSYQGVGLCPFVALTLKPRQEIEAEVAIWMDLAHPSRAQEPLGYHGIAGVCRQYLDTSKVHITRHSFALLMQALGAKLTDIQKLLLHSNADISSLKDDVAAMQTDINSLKERLSTIESRLESVEGELHTGFAAMNERFEAIIALLSGPQPKPPEP